MRSRFLAQNHQASTVERRTAGDGDLEEDAKPLKRCETEKQEWAMPCQCGEEVQELADKPWKNEALRRQEGGLPRLKEEKLQNAARGFQDTSGDGFHTKVPLDLTKKTRWRKWSSCEKKVEKMREVAAAGLQDSCLHDSEERPK